MSCTRSLAELPFIPLTEVSQSHTRAESRVYQEDGGGTRPLVAQQKEVHKLVYKGMWTANISVSKKVSKKYILSSHFQTSEQYNRIVTIFKRWKEAFTSPLYKDDVSNPRSADMVKITSHKAKACYIDSFSL